MKNASEILRDKKIDAVFCESIFHSYRVEDIDTSYLGPTFRGVYEIAKENNARIEKTEDKNFPYFFHGKWIPIEAVLKNVPLAGRIVRSIDYQARKRRDYEMGKNISERLKEGETGVIFHGRLHRPAKYVRSLSPDTKVEPLFKKDEIFLE